MIHLIHGIHSGGPSWIQGFIPYLAPSAVSFPDYGWIAGLETRAANPIIVGCLKPYIAPDDVLICHSNGCAIGYDLMNAGVKRAPSSSTPRSNAASSGPQPWDGSTCTSTRAMRLPRPRCARSA